MICEISFGGETFIGQLLALITFFAFPAIKYLILKCTSKNQGRPELWYLPAYGFRLVIRNIPSNKVLTDLKYKTKLRKIIPASSVSSVSTFQDEILKENEDFFLFPDSDQILICFKITGNNASNLNFTKTDKLGNNIKDFSLTDIDELISDYSVNVKNLFNFDIKIAKRVIIKAPSFVEYWKTLQSHNYETSFACDKIIDIG